MSGEKRRCWSQKLISRQEARETAEIKRKRNGVKNPNTQKGCGNAKRGAPVAPLVDALGFHIIAIMAPLASGCFPISGA